MAIVLDEYKYAEKAIYEHRLGRTPYEVLSRVAKYYAANGHDKTEVRKLMDDFLLKCDYNASLVSWSDTLDAATRGAFKYPIVRIDHIDITGTEMQKIDSLPSKQMRRLAFTLLCVAKYMVLVSEKTNYWVSTPDSELMAMANINTSIKRQSLLFGGIKDAGLIRFSKKIDNLSVQVMFADDGDTVMRVSDFRNLGYQYNMYHGEQYYTCEECGLVCKINKNARGRKPKYCPDCAAKVKTRQNVNSVMRHRSAISIG